jgi:hypothetical protein
MAKQEKHLEGPSLPTTIPYFRLVVDHARVTQAVYDHKYDGSGTNEDPFVVDWIPDDPGNPLRMKTSTKWLMSMVVATSTLGVAFNSSAYSGMAANVPFPAYRY